MRHATRPSLSVATTRDTAPFDRGAALSRGWSAPRICRVLPPARYVAITASLTSGIRREVAVGSLMSYSPDRPNLYRRGAAFIDKILKGARPADLPVERAMRFELALNLKTAWALEATPSPVAAAPGGSAHRTSNPRLVARLGFAPWMIIRVVIVLGSTIAGWLVSR